MFSKHSHFLTNANTNSVINWNVLQIRICTLFVKNLTGNTNNNLICENIHKYILKNSNSCFTMFLVKGLNLFILFTKKIYIYISLFSLLGDLPVSDKIWGPGPEISAESVLRNNCLSHSDPDGGQQFSQIWISLKLMSWSV